VDVSYISNLGIGAVTIVDYKGRIPEPLMHAHILATKQKNQNYVQKQSKYLNIL
jgi:hypothetical protein